MTRTVLVVVFMAWFVCVLSSPHERLMKLLKNHKEQETGKRSNYYYSGSGSGSGYGSGYDPYDWYSWYDYDSGSGSGSGYDPYYDWSSWYDGFDYGSGSGSGSAYYPDYWYDYDWGTCADGEVEDMSGNCVNVDDVCSDSTCSEDDYLCLSYMYYYRSMKRGLAKKNINENFDDKKIKARAFHMAKKREQPYDLLKGMPKGREENKRRIKLERNLQGLRKKTSVKENIADIMRSLTHKTPNGNRLHKRQKVAPDNRQ